MAANAAGALWGEKFQYPAYLAVVVRLADGQTIKGFLENRGNSPTAAKAQFLSKEPLIVHQETETATIDPASLQSIFFVRSLIGESKREEMRFLDDSGEPPALWVRAQCDTLEVLEGSTDNNLDLFLEDGFFLRPADSHSNNMLIYINKGHLRRLQVMGFQAPPRINKSKSSTRMMATKTENA